MFGLGTPELIVIMGIVFVLFGGKKLPELGSGLGRGIKAFKSGLRDVEESGKEMLQENVPGAKEVAAFKEEVSKVADLGKAVKG